MPLYYLADATITLARRIVRREPFWQAHRTHFYQRATDNGFTVPEIVARVFLVNLALAALAVDDRRGGQHRRVAGDAGGGSAAVAWLLLVTFARAKRVKRSGRFAAEIRHRVAQHAEDHRAVLAREPLLQRREPAAHRLERGTDRLGRDDAVDADLARSAPRARTGFRAAARPAGCR